MSAFIDALRLHQFDDNFALDLTRTKANHASLDLVIAIELGSPFEFSNCQKKVSTGSSVPNEAG